MVGADKSTELHSSTSTYLTTYLLIYLLNIATYLPTYSPINVCRLTLALKSYYAFSNNNNITTSAAHSKREILKFSGI